MIFGLFRRHYKQLAPTPQIGDLSPETQAYILAGLKQQRQRLNSQIDEARFQALSCKNTAISYDEMAAASRRAQHAHEAEAKGLLEQHDAICRTIGDMGGWSE